MLLKSGILFWLIFLLFEYREAFIYLGERTPSDKYMRRTILKIFIYKILIAILAVSFYNLNFQ